MQVDIYTDGSCLNNPGYGGVGISVFINEQFFSKAFSPIIFYYLAENYIDLKSFSQNGLTTNNRMEIAGIIYALNIISKYDSKNISWNIYSDSQYAVNSINKWIDGWKKNNWKNSKKKIVENIDMWKFFDKIKNEDLQDHNIIISHIMGHQKLKGHKDQDTQIKGNNFADEYANKMSAKIKDIYSAEKNIISKYNYDTNQLFLKSFYSIEYDEKNNCKNKDQSYLKFTENSFEKYINSELFYIYHNDLESIEEIKSFIESNAS